MKQFDEKIQQNPVFAEQVAFYCITIQEIKKQVAEEKKQRFRKIYNQRNNNKVTGMPLVRKWWPYIAAAAVLAGIIFGLLIFNKPVDSTLLADQYIQAHFQTLPVTMSGREDNMQKGLQLYNENNFPAALQQFENILQSDTTDFAAKKNAGIVCLRMAKYDEALNYFGRMANQPGYYSNPGLFLEAVALLKRNQPGDSYEAKKLLQLVVRNNLAEKNIAEEWLRQW